MIIAASELPNDVEALKAMVLSMASEVAQLRTINEDAEARITRLRAILKTLERARFGRRSERLSDDQIAFEEAETGLGAVEAELDRGPPKRERAPRQRKAFPAHLERVEVVVEPETAACACGACERVKIGEDVSERLDVVPARFRVIVTRRPKYACKACGEGIVQAEAPARLIEGGVPTEALLAHVVVSKYADGLPLYRQEGIYARDGVMLGRSVQLAGPERGLEEIQAIAGSDRLSAYPFYSAALGELQLKCGNPVGARGHFQAACGMARNAMEREFFERRIRACM